MTCVDCHKIWESAPGLGSSPYQEAVAHGWCKTGAGRSNKTWNSQRGGCCSGQSAGGGGPCAAGAQNHALQVPPPLVGDPPPPEPPLPETQRWHAPPGLEPPRLLYVQLPRVLFTEVQSEVDIQYLHGQRQVQEVIEELPPLGLAIEDLPTAVEHQPPTTSSADFHSMD